MNSLSAEIATPVIFAIIGRRFPLFRIADLMVLDISSLMVSSNGISNVNSHNFCRYSFGRRRRLCGEDMHNLCSDQEIRTLEYDKVGLLKDSRCYLRKEKPILSSV